MGTRRNGVVIVHASKKDIKDKKWMVVYSDGNGTYANFYKTFLGMSSRAKWERKQTRALPLSRTGS